MVKGDNPTMKLIADDKGRLTCRELFEPRATFDADCDSHGRVILTRLNPARPRVRLERRKGRTLLVSDQKITVADVERVLDQFP